MANSKEIKDRIKGIEQTRKITKAMHLISSVKMGSAKAELDNSTPYFDALKENLRNVLSQCGGIESRYIENRKTGGDKLLLVFSAEKGLSGAFNQNIMEEAVKSANGGKTRIFISGECGKQYFSGKGIPFDESFNCPAVSPTMETAKEISDLIISRYNSGEFSKVEIIFTDCSNALTQKVERVCLLPLGVQNYENSEQDNTDDFEFIPSGKAVLENLVRRYVTGYIYFAALSSFYSEQQARMTAMDSANKNADELLRELSLQYNHIRQNAITLEITEVVAGGKAQKKKQKEE